MAEGRAVGPPVPPARTWRERALHTALRWALAAAVAWLLFAVRGPLVRELRAVGFEVRDVGVYPGCGFVLVGAAATAVLLVGALLRHAESRRPPFGVPLVVAALLGVYVLPVSSPPPHDETVLFAQLGVPGLAAVLGVAEVSLRRLPATERGTAWLLFAATLLHALAWWGLLLASRIT